MKTADGKTILQLECFGEPRLEGNANNLVWIVTASRRKKSGDVERFELRLGCCRWSIQRIARQIATMHARDRQLLATELRRIEMEAEAIKQPEAQG